MYPDLGSEDVHFFQRTSCRTTRQQLFPSAKWKNKMVKEKMNRTGEFVG
jgi:hypothetical protein